MAYTINDVQLRLANRLGESSIPSVTSELTKRRLWMVEAIQEILKKRPLWFTQHIFTDKTVANKNKYEMDATCRKEFMVYVDGYKYEKIMPDEVDRYTNRLVSLNSSFTKMYYTLGSYIYLLPIPTSSSESKSVTSITSSGTTCTVTLTNHGFVTDNYVTIAGADQSEYNGKFQITYVDSDTFTYTALSAPSLSPATGTITATLDNIEIWGYKEPTLPSSDSDGIVIPDKYINALVAYAEGRFWSSAHKRGKAADAFVEFDTVVNDILNEDTRRNFLSGQWKQWEI